MEREAIHLELESCRKRGLLKPEDVIERARDPKSILHERFTWDDGDAAHQYRLIEARNLIRVHVLHEVKDAGPVPVYVSLTIDRANAGGGYRKLSSVMRNREWREQLLSDALTQLQNVQAKYRHLKKLDKVWDAIDEASETNRGSRAA